MAKYFSYKLRKDAHLILSCFVLVAILILPNTISAQKNGQITGRVFDLATKEYLPGANVVLKGTTFGAATDRSGLYRIVNVPPGDYELVVSYIGFESQTVNVTIGTQGFTLNQDVGIKASDVQMREIQITGMLQGQTKALNLQKNSENIKNVVAEEQIKSFPDINAAEVLQRIPGVSIQRDQGEGRYVQVRGAQARLNLMTVNGQEIPSPERAIRNVMLDVVPADQLSSIEVTKAITPDMEGNSIGGTVNLITKSALDYEKPILDVTVGSGYSNLHGKGYPGASMPGVYQANVTYGTRFGEAKNLGIIVSGSFLRTDRGSDNNEPVWGPVTLNNTEKTPVPWALTDLQIREYTLRRDRSGISGTLDYLISEGNKLSFKAIFTEFTDSEIRMALRARPSRGLYTSPTVVTNGTFEKILRDRSQTQNIINFQGRGEHNLGSLILDYTLSYSLGQEKQNWHYSPTFVGRDRVDFLFDLSNTDIPTWTITKPVAGYDLDPTKFRLSGIRFQDYKTKNTAYTTTVNLKFPYSLSGYQAEVKFGGKVDLRKKSMLGLDINYTPPTTTVLMSQFIGDMKVDKFLAGNYNFGPIPDNAKIKKYFQDNWLSMTGVINRDNTDARNYETSENIYSFYAMTTINFGKLSVLAGARNEITTDKIKANQIDYGPTGVYLKTTPIETEGSYNTFLPMVHFRYKFDEQTNIRVAVTTGIGRPDYYDLVPYRIANDQSDNITMGNKDLKPTSSLGFDILAERYFQGIGILSGSFFYKNLSNIIYSSVYTQSGGIYDKWRVTQPVNGGDAKLYGFEFDWQQQLTFLPGFLDGLGIYLNYTYTKSSTDLPGNLNSKLPGQAGNVGNAALSYQKYGFTAKVSLSYADKFMDVVGVDADNSVYYDSHTQLDVTANQEIFAGFSAYVQFMNLTNAPLRYYIGDTTRPIQREYYSWWMQAGVKFSL